MGNACKCQFDENLQSLDTPRPSKQKQLLAEPKSPKNWNSTNTKSSEGPDSMEFNKSIGYLMKNFDQNLFEFRDPKPIKSNGKTLFRSMSLNMSRDSNT